MRGKNMVEMCRTAIEQGPDIISMSSEQNTMDFRNLIDQAEIIFDNEMSSPGFPNNQLLQKAETLELASDQHHDIILPPDPRNNLLANENKGVTNLTVMTEDTTINDISYRVDPIFVLSNKKIDSTCTSHTVTRNTADISTDQEYYCDVISEDTSVNRDEKRDEIFVPSSENSNGDGSSENGESVEEQSDSIPIPSLKSKRKINKDLRMKGKAFVGFKRPRNQKRTFQDVEREERKLGIRCNSETCKKSSKRNCSEVTDEIRKQMFTAFWNDLNWEQRKVYVANLVLKQETVRKTKEVEHESRRSYSLYYHLNLGDKTVPVCKNMFLQTLGLKEWSVKSWVEKSQYGLAPNVTRNDRRFLSRTTQNDSFISTFLEKLPKLPSHYCRKDTKKLYLEQDFCSYSDLYKAFLEYSKEKNIPPASRNTLMKWVKKMDIGIFKPRKDLCDTCVEYESGNLSLEKWEKHRKDKDRAQKEKLNDKEKAIKGTCNVITVDLQAVKTCPSLQASSLYFKTKLVCHNYTVYDLSTHHCTCYWFSEIDADLQASTFASLLVDYLTRKYLQDPENIKPIVIYFDGCTYQNRNSTMANALLSLSCQYNVTIIQKYLVKGHSQMECDSVHATIEKRIKNKNIEIPNDYYRLTEEARHKPFPYEVVSPNFDFFVNFNTKFVYDSIRPGKKSSDPTVTEIRALKYEQGIISYTLGFDQEFLPLPHRPKKIPNQMNEFPRLFNNRLPISKKKFDDLQSIKTKISQNYWTFYDNLAIL